MGTRPRPGLKVAQRAALGSVEDSESIGDTRRPHQNGDCRDLTPRRLGRRVRQHMLTDDERQHMLTRMTRTATDLAGRPRQHRPHGRPAGRRRARSPARPARDPARPQRPRQGLVLAGDRRRARRHQADRPPQARPEVAVFERFTRDARAVVISTQDICLGLGVRRGATGAPPARPDRGGQRGRGDLLAAHGITHGCRGRLPRGRAADSADAPSVTTTPRRCVRSASTSTPSARPSSASSARVPSTRTPPRTSRARPPAADAGRRRATPGRPAAGSGWAAGSGSGEARRRCSSSRCARRIRAPGPARSAASTSRSGVLRADDEAVTHAAAHASASTRAPCAPTSRTAAARSA